MLEIDSIVVQSPLLKRVLKGVLANYPGVTTTLKRLTFQAPFHPFVHRWEELSNAVKDETDSKTKEHLALLHSTLKTELAETIAAKDDFIANKVITFEHLWTIFQPGCVVHTIDYGRDCAIKFSQGQYINHDRYGKCYQLISKKIDWDGEKFGWTGESPLITGFAGTKAITDLEAFPLEFHPNHVAITKALIIRGKLFEHYAGYHYKMYTGIAIAQTQCGPARINVDSRIIIDRYAHNRFNPNQNRSVEALVQELPTARSRDSDSDSEDEYSYSDTDEEYTAVKGKEPKRFDLTPNQLILCTPLVKGYALRTKRWLQFFVDQISEIVWDANAFDSLVLPHEQKELILAFAESQILYKEQFDDIISGKGKGIILLLSGSPGVGKTLTAESVSEHMKVPLFMMGASDLGTDSSEVEDSLNRILEMVSKWSAILLIDEADVYLEARSTNDLERNKLVSIFLRTLEYYEGILFMTTNRVDNIDSAFQSRISVSIHYESLDSVSRKQVWKNFLDREGVKHELSDIDIDNLAKLDLNGRQIKNMLKTSQLLACRKKEPLKFAHLKTVVDVEQKSGSFQNH